MLKLALRRSQNLGLLLLVIHGVSILVLAGLPLSVWIKILGFPVLAASFAIYFLRDARLSQPGSVVELELHEDLGCAAKTKNGEWQEYEILPDSFVSPYLVVLLLRPKARARARRVIVFSDALDAEDFRGLCLLLRWGHKSG